MGLIPGAHRHFGELRRRINRRAKHCGNKKINFSTVFAGQAVGIKEVQDGTWLVSFMDCDLDYFDFETRVLEPLDNPFRAEFVSDVRETGNLCVPYVV